jgi:hypothetical protein
MFPSKESVLRLSASGAALMVVAMIAVFFATGVGQDPLQFIHPSDEYARLLLHNPAALRTAVGLDNAFIAFYTTTFVVLALVLEERGAKQSTVRIALGMLLFLGFLDLLENTHFLTMLQRAEQGLPPSDFEIGAQVMESLVKFHVGYFAVFVLAMTMPRTTAEERWLANLSTYVQLPVGLLIYVTPRAVAVPLVFVRFGYFLTAFVLLAWCFGPKSKKSGSLPTGVVADSSAPA